LRFPPFLKLFLYLPSRSGSTGRCSVSTTYSSGFGALPGTRCYGSGFGTWVYPSKK
jgi:hypothetical protein